MRWISLSARCWCSRVWLWARCSWSSRSVVVVAAVMSRAHRHRVDQQAHHRFRAGQLGRPPRDRDAEGDIVVAGQPHSSCAKAPCSTVLTVVWRERASSPRARVVSSGTRNDATPRRPSPNLLRRADQGGGVKTGQHLAPGRAGGIKVAIGQPGNKPAIRPGRGQPLPVIAGEYFPQQDRHRPAIEHDVVIGQHEPVPVCLRCGSTPPERPAGRRGRRPRRVRRRTPAGSAHRHRRRRRPVRHTARAPRDPPG